ncbi:MAG: hypothetical protein AAFQ82_09370 [Myxococcota bacterium]
MTDVASIPAIEPVPRRFTYQVALFLTALVLLVLPLLYLALIAATGFGTFYHLTENTFLFSTGKGGILVYVTAALTGLVLFFVLATPVYAALGQRIRGAASVAVCSRDRSVRRSHTARQN